ncbi:uncharacterized protein LOC129928442 [Biomphalaria glabrata]|uniref:Uncharacterized protein LOC129928442 n=1 Tax=Biomphalaria glabrata TaxID=6526 RepID=A0A9W3BHG9_BIOGL|nr:uncharacterized protein LOC129928442 [Biomphalaria glabrata]XP_055898878.1 uncharacterized protein LOC129928442 [Biomphalaria glabrata]
MDNDLKDLHQNLVGDRRLAKDYQELERQSLREIVNWRQKRREIVKDYKRVIQRSPDTDEWMQSRKARKDSWQTRERDEISKRYCRRYKHFRAPPDLKETADKIKSVIKESVGELALPKQTRSHDFSPISTKLTPHGAKRRHSVPAECQTSSLPEIIEPLRRMTLGHIEMTKDVHKSGSNLGNRVYLCDIKDRKYIVCRDYP